MKKPAASRLWYRRVLRGVLRKSSIEVGELSGEILDDVAVGASRGAGSGVSGGVKGGTNILKHGYKYASRIRARALQDPVAHNFPYSFDDEILKVEPIIQADGSLLFRKAGTLNGKSGFFEIALNPNTKTIFHRTFVGSK